MIKIFVVFFSLLEVLGLGKGIHSLNALVATFSCIEYEKCF